MRFSIVLCAAAALALSHDHSSAQPAGAAAPADHAPPAAREPGPMEAFARLIGGRWKMTTTAGRDTFDTWHWGPGELSIRSVRAGTLTEGEPWRTLTVFFWHPTLKEIRTVGISSVMRGVRDGAITFEGDHAESVFTLSQTAGTRSLRERWTFAGPDRYHDELSEKLGGRYELLAGWDRSRVAAATPEDRRVAPPLAPDGTPSELMRPLVKVLGDWWASADAPAPDAPRPADGPRTRTRLEYVPHADAIYARVETITADGPASHAMDVYLFHHTGTRTLRCLALAGQGPDSAAVYEGDITPADDGRSFSLRLTEHRHAGRRALEARVELDPHGPARLQVWPPEAPARTMVLDAQFRRERE